MTTAKKLIFISASAGASFAVVLALTIAAHQWWVSRPKPPLPWNVQAITAGFEGIRATGTDQRIAFRYTLRNNTDSDYRIESMDGIWLMGKLEHPASLWGNKGGFFKLDLPFFLPAREQARFEIESVLGFKGESKATTGTGEEPTHKELTAFVNKEMGNLNGFVLFDEARHYKIDFPKGWSKQ